MFTHFLFTRFNLPLKFVNELKPRSEQMIEKSNKDRLNPEWLDKRMRFFRKFCLPSVLNQTTKNFHWIIFVGAQTPRTYVNELSKDATVYQTDLVDFEAEKEIITKAQDGFIIGTNLDSDDGLSENFLEVVQKQFRGENEYINIPSGCILRAYEGGAYEYIGRDRLQNPFRSLIDATRFGLYTVTHGLSSQFFPVRQVEGSSALWLQVVHGDNLSNRLKKYGNDKLANFDLISQRFGYDYPVSTR